MGHSCGLVERRGENVPGGGNEFFQGNRAENCQVYNKSKEDVLIGKQRTGLANKIKSDWRRIRNVVGKGLDRSLSAAQAEELGLISRL